ncbi:DUF6893 family small protein [Nocardiopsis salina]
MRTLGKVTALALVALAGVLVVVAVRSKPDIERYQRIRRM